MRRATLSEAFARIGAGEPQEQILSDFLDDFYLCSSPEAKFSMLKDRPALTGNARIDALAGAIAHYLAHQHKLASRPRWAFEPERFLSEPWHTTYVDIDWRRVYLTDGMREYLTFASPAEFRSRNIFTEERPFRRAATQA